MMKKQIPPKNSPSNRLAPIPKYSPAKKPNNKAAQLTPKSNLPSNSNSSAESRSDPLPESNGNITNRNSPFIIVDQESYNERRIKELVQTNNVLSHEIEALQNKILEKDFQIRHLSHEVNDLRQNYDKVKSVLHQKMNLIKEEENDLHLVRTESMLRLKKQGVSGESFSPSSVEMKIYEKSEEAMHLIEMAITGCQNDFLKKLEPMQIKQICQYMYAKTVKANFYIIREGEVGEHMYVLASGKMEVIKDGNKLRDMYPGELFGELAVLQNCLRTASVKAISEASFWTIDRKVYQTILQKSNLQQSAEHEKFLQSVNLFKNLSKEELVKVVDSLMPEKYKKGDYIVKEGENGETFFIIKHGQVKVEQTIDGKNEPQEIRKLKEGDYFGERALLKNEIRTASVIAYSDIVEVLVLDREDFIRLIGQNDELNAKDYGDEKRKTQILPVTVSELAIKDEVSESSFGKIELNDLEFIAILGIGGFGKVELVRYKNDKSLVFALKSLNKQFIVEMKQQDHIFSEKNILLRVKSAFICQLYRTYRDKKYVYMLLEPCLGGEVWTILRNKMSFDEKTTKFVMGCVILAIKYLHSNGIIYRDLKPENLVLDNTGYVKLCDFGFAKSIAVGRKTFTFCGTPEYVAPEIILNRGHDSAADIWSLGILVFELQTGSPPFQGDDPMKVYNQILKGIDKIEFHAKTNKSTQQLIKMLCKDNPTERLGYGKAGISAIMNHKYFFGFNWDTLAKREIIPPIIPKLESNIDTRYFDRFPNDKFDPIDETSGWDIGFEY